MDGESKSISEALFQAIKAEGDGYHFYLMGQENLPKVWACLLRKTIWGLVKGHGGTVCLLMMVRFKKHLSNRDLWTIVQTIHLRSVMSIQ